MINGTSEALTDRYTTHGTSIDIITSGYVSFSAFSWVSTCDISSPDSEWLTSTTKTFTTVNSSGSTSTYTETLMATDITTTVSTTDYSGVTAPRQQ